MSRRQRCPKQVEDSCHVGYTGTTANADGANARKRPMFVRSADWTGSRALVAVPVYDSRTVLRLPASGCCGRVIFEQPTSHGFTTPSASPDGKEIALAIGTGAYEGAGAIGILSLQTRRLRPLTSLAPSARRAYSQPAWSPDGRFLVFANLDFEGKGRDDLLVMPRSGRLPRVLVTGGREPTWGATAPK